MSELPAALEARLPRLARAPARLAWRVLSIRLVQFVVAGLLGFILTAIALPQMRFLLDAYHHGGL